MTHQKGDLLWIPQAAMLYRGPKSPMAVMMNPEPKVAIYLNKADYQDYIECQEQVSQAFQDQGKWTKMSIYNSVRMGKFSSDRTIMEYAKEIWEAEPVKINQETYTQDNAGLRVNNSLV